VKAVNVSHCVYNLAIPLRLAIARKIPAFQSNATHIYRLNKNNYFAYSDYKYFPQTFAQLPNATKLEGIAESKRRIDQRFSGQTGVDMAYSTKSAYGQKKNAPLLIKSDRPKILVATHCFYDSPHSYGNNLFPDFYEWLEFLGKIAELTNYDWYIKTHPDFIPGTKEVIDNFIDKYPKFILLPPDSSHNQIIEEGIDVALTVYGTIGFEYAALGIPVINCSLNNPHIAYNFNLHPKNVDQYKDLLMNLSTKKLNIDIHEVYEYYYMKNIYNTEDLFFNNYQLVIKRLGGYSKQFTNDIYDFWISEWTPEKNRKILNGIEVYVLSGDFRMNYKHIQ
jgi:capsule polysaccharide export protein KpsC/LpsZ